MLSDPETEGVAIVGGDEIAGEVGSFPGALAGQPGVERTRAHFRHAQHVVLGTYKLEELVAGADLKVPLRLPYSNFSQNEKSRSSLQSFFIFVNTQCVKFAVNH